MRKEAEREGEKGQAGGEALLPEEGGAEEPQKGGEGGQGYPYNSLQLVLKGLVSVNGIETGALGVCQLEDESSVLYCSSGPEQLPPCL